jgi:hypothetical protein
MNLKFIRDLIYKIPVSEKLQEQILTVLRIALFAAVSAVINYVLALLKADPNPTVITLAITYILNELDKKTFALNKAEKVVGTENLGLAGF